LSVQSLTFILFASSQNSSPVKFLNYIFLLICLWATLPTITAQNPIKKYEWGDVPLADRTMTFYDADRTADALVLAAITKLKVELKEGKPQMTVSVYRRVKLFTDASLTSQGSLEVPIDFAQNQFKLGKIKAQMMDEQGFQLNVEVSEILQANNRRLVFSGLKTQQVLEVSYEMTSDNLESISNWSFQEMAPVRHAELWTTIDAAFEHGFMLQNEKNIRIILDSKSGAKVFSTHDLPANKPALEAFSITSGDQITGVRLQLKSIEIADKGKKPIVSSWSELANRVEKNEGIGQQYLKKWNFDALWRAAQPLVNAAKTDEAKIKAVYDFVNQNIRWNEEWNTTASTTLNASFEKKTANSGELNLMLIACLNEAGFKAYPMLVSTRQHGKPNQSTPFLSQFNHLLCYVENGATPLMLDAGSIHRTMGLPRVESLNGDAWLVNPKNPQWLPMPSKITARQTLAAFAVTAEGDMKGRFSKTSKDHEAISERDEQVRRRAVKALEKAYPGIRIDSISNSNTDNASTFFKRNIYCFLSQVATVDSHKLTVKPLWRTGFEVNPLAAVPLNSSFDFPYLIQDLHVFALQIPSGSTIEREPTGEMFEMPDKSAGLSLSVTRNADIMQLSLVVKINKLHFEASEYFALKDFFDKIIAKQAETIVVKLPKA
jgi:hypothetical protein